MVFTLPGLRLILILFAVNSLFSFSVHSQTRTEIIAKDSYAINLGITPQTNSNALKPYGFIYKLLAEYPVAIKWVINPEKEKDGVDFRLEEEDFRSGSFVIPVSYISEDIRSEIKSWEEKGMVGNYLDKEKALPVFTDLSVAPKWTLDKQNGNIALTYFRAAGIPGSAHGGYDPDNWKTPEELGVCDDIFVMPHAEPKFDTHKNLYFWNKNFKGAIWAGCHAGSQLENLYGNVIQERDTTMIQLNFLSEGAAGARTTGLIPFYEHRFATPPYQHQLPSDPVSQYLGRSDKALINGSERIFYPKKANVWRASSKMIIIDPTAPDVPSLSNGPGSVMLYGNGFGNEKNGLVMYQASHDFSGDSPENIAAIRAFFNWSFYATEVKREENIIQFQNSGGDKIFAARVGDDLAKMLKLDPIIFDLDKAEIKPQAAKQLDEIAAYMIEYPELLIDIRSHTDSRADDTYNVKLSQNRVQVTREYLVNMGVSEDRISGRGYGETELVNNCRNGIPCSEASHEKNRRSEFILSINCDIYTGNLKL
ncbi:OmpA family protein [Christiangramia echinicola]|uniref:Outer membrane protein OmpA n=1 Tax=Christiangramia echinicola TaxID=279359 RepID=A0A1H1PUU1_9FLAO|nr:OmpA family protein [Christiangramia echinicola]SDS14958.1 Outer membrane protein OmpA [Christiangramia echinicola]